ncbi:MAG TPA: hypothetical protein PK691_00785 [Thermomicrobiales bacterium]|nr:hypothetical protein [Thermomicrobiales bacterium]HRA46641.1 hypothetical protein [Thermomicrobiales bacterium]
MVAPTHASAIYPDLSRTAGDTPIADLTTDSIIIRLHFMINHLSRWITPIHDLERLDRAPFRDQPSVKSLMIDIREEERRVFPKMYLISRETNPDLDRLPIPEIDARQAAIDAQRSSLSVLAEIRRLRQSTCSLLRSLTDAGWNRVGTSRIEHDWQIRSLAEALVAHDEMMLTLIDIALEDYGLRDGVAEHGSARYFELLKLVPVTTMRTR